jgi:hypothetical protein
MPYIKSVAPDQEAISAPGAPNYAHPAATRAAHAIPFAFQVTSPYDPRKVLLPHSLVMHVNPSSFQETFNKKIERFTTRGGYVEQHWGDELGEISCDASTGAFVNLYTGLSSVVRQRTIAWDRYRDLYDLYRNNGSLYDPYGNIVLQGNIMMMYDRGTYLGTFRRFDVEETDQSPFAFKISYTFKVERTIYQMPINGYSNSARTPRIQNQQTLPATLSGAETNFEGATSRTINTTLFGERASVDPAQNASLQASANAKRGV